MKLLLLYFLILPNPQQHSIQDGMDNHASVKKIHIGVTRFVCCDLVKVKDSHHKSLVVAELTLFRSHYRYAGEYTGHLIKGN